MLLLCALVAGAWSPPARAQRAVYLVRHAEKDGDALTPTGEAQAAKLAELLKDAGITAIYTTQFERTKRTAGPLATRLRSRGIAIESSSLDLPADLVAHPEDPDRLASYGRSVVAAVRQQGPDAIVLIVGHDTTIPAIIRALGIESPPTIAPAEFDRLFQVIPRPTGDQGPLGFLELQHYAQ
jgi:broad specificity phosphatase PhoE